MTDFIYTITIDLTGEGKGEFVTEKNYKEILRDLEGLISVSEKDNDNLEEQVEKLAEVFIETEMSCSEWYNKIDKISKQRRDNNEYIKSCEKTIEILQKIAELRGWE